MNSGNCRWSFTCFYSSKTLTSKIHPMSCLKHLFHTFSVAPASVCIHLHEGVITQSACINANAQMWRWQRSPCSRVRDFWAAPSWVSPHGKQTRKGRVMVQTRLLTGTPSEFACSSSLAIDQSNLIQSMKAVGDHSETLETTKVKQT